VLKRTGAPLVTTLHGRLELPHVREAASKFPNAAYVSISDHQRIPVSNLNWQGTVHHGMPADTLRFSAAPSGDLVFLGHRKHLVAPCKPCEVGGGAFVIVGAAAARHDRLVDSLSARRRALRLRASIEAALATPGIALRMNTRGVRNIGPDVAFAFGCASSG
jgi:hypothetical protein